MEPAAEAAAPLQPQPEEAVAQPAPAPFVLDGQGKPAPLPGVEPVFLTGTTVELLGLQPPPPPDGGPAAPLLLITVPKEKLLGDIQFRGAISDFHALKGKIQGADYDALVVRYLPDDVYGEGCNYEVRPPSC